jgi:hypothetical protein
LDNNDKKLKGFFFLLFSETQEPNILPHQRQQQLEDICYKFNCTQQVVGLIFTSLAKRYCRLWLSWNSHCIKLLRWSKKYLTYDEADEASLQYEWDLMIMRSQAMWEQIVSGNTVVMQFESEEDQLEEEILQLDGEDMEDDNLELQDIED